MSLLGSDVSGQMYEEQEYDEPEAEIDQSFLLLEQNEKNRPEKKEKNTITQTQKSKINLV